MQATQETKLTLISKEGQVLDVETVYKRVEKKSKVQPEKQVTGFFKDGIFCVSNTNVSL